MSGLVSSLTAGRTFAAAAPRRRLADCLALMKLRLVTLVLVTTAVGFCLGHSGPVSLAAFVLLAHTIAGTALVAAGAMALNQYLERDSDGRMSRTRSRPLPAGRLAAADALLIGSGAVVVGLLYLVDMVNSLAAVLAGLTVLFYLSAYTPLKTRTPLCTLVGAVPGAIPPMIGYAAAVGTIDGVAAGLFAILFVWQMPHFYSIAWLYREDYARGGQMMLPVLDPSGVRTARQIIAFSALLLPVTLAPAMTGVAGRLYLAGALVLGVAFIGFAIALAAERTKAAARQMFFISVLYLPLLLGLLVYDRTMP